MMQNKKVAVVMPAYNAAKTLLKTYNKIPHNIVDDIILVDDKSSDDTIAEAKKLNLKLYVHNKNKGYGGNQKTCYRQALNAGADIVVMLHPDYQYNPALITAMSSLIAEGIYDVVLGSRILGGKSIRNGMPFYKYIANRFLTFIENLMVGEKLSEYHTGYRVFSREVLENLPLLENSDDFLFDNQMLLQAIYFGFKVGEISCPTRYEADSSSINLVRSIKYGLGVLWTALQFIIAKSGLIKISIFDKNGKKL
ncbi:glycosyl transferase family 2 [Candidatus Falkowbacteria bacterium CG_4_9_14_3_um_filter_36_9]|uniref:Glycosyl transferase family 2 n=1 Tax=Candidatus Falkowbacteria bacterium CG02_land_8_20_14_3_00_36_14 TaxID=1974560 RepID=A0A2M7DLG4_9BACT|nr:MAG: glycosyl transferase family 2 [Candidatus Falkowbacteria bacterium CG02_land_8_20_14_3_00_36_14]PJA11219.1 MAG: glycosyl transferase family 2 [Candidatus Falkowbacteria bacterium CG_4_10_14_0_2_um_filter_36_22]PJB20118.1 MAG: glycosyl transferase family 2 [Candidatus Falkowbacteria bacterium CG_4_9_14_3_um_filter_36_9]